MTMKILGIDFGLRKIGLAIAEDGFIQPIKTLGDPSKFVKEVAKICQENKIALIVIGISEGIIAKRAKAFADKLAKLVDLPLDFQDETLTTQEAIAKMIAIGKGKKARRELEDAYAAACILEEYLAERRGNV